MPPVPFTNTLLNAFAPDIIERLHLKRVRFKIRQEIEFPGKPIRHLYFLEEGMASMTTSFLNGSQVEVGMFGYESVIGVSALMGTRLSLNRIYTQIIGWGYECSVDHAKAEFARAGEFQRLALRYVQAQLVQTMQSAGCNARHSFEPRLARWLLICADRAHKENFKMSHEFLADMLGSTRPTVSTSAAHLKAEGLIQYTRGLITIHDRKGLERRSCECYTTVRDYLDNYLSFDADSKALTKSVA